MNTRVHEGVELFDSVVRIDFGYTDFDDARVDHFEASSLKVEKSNGTVKDDIVVLDKLDYFIKRIVHNVFQYVTYTKFS